MTLELTDAEADIIKDGLGTVIEAYGRLAYVLRGKKSRYRDTVNERIAIAERLRGKLAVAARNAGTADTRPPCKSDTRGALP